MAQFLVIGRDNPPPDGPARRLQYQPEHRQGLKALVEAGHLLLAGPLTDDIGAPTGSIMIMEFESKDHLDAWLRTEPYMVGLVWSKADVTPMRVTVTSS